MFVRKKNIEISFYVHLYVTFNVCEFIFLTRPNSKRLSSVFKSSRPHEQTVWSLEPDHVTQCRLLCVAMKHNVA